MRLPAEEAIRRRRRRPICHEVDIFQDKILTAARGIRAQKLPRPNATVCSRHVSNCHVLDTHNASHIWARVWVLRGWAVILCYPDWNTHLDHAYIFIGDVRYQSVPSLPRLDVYRAGGGVEKEISEGQVLHVGGRAIETEAADRRSMA